MSAELMVWGLCPSSVRLWLRLSLNLLHGFLSNIGCCFPWAICWGHFFIFWKKKSLNFFTNIFHFRYHGTLWEPKLQNATAPSNYFWILSNFSWIFFSVVLTKVVFWIFEILSFWFLTNFWNSPLYPVGNPKTSIIWKTSNHRAKLSEIWTNGWVFSVYREILTLKC